MRRETNEEARAANREPRLRRRVCGGWGSSPIQPPDREQHECEHDRDRVMSDPSEQSFSADRIAGSDPLVEESSDTDEHTPREELGTVDPTLFGRTR